ncbi:MAG: glycosyltransferase family 4 protein [Candidatus Aureabacteria bacterium]|nr:glycosyltransferase family 4 protein [Candidatus Auribacterota bacterium]
MNPKTKLTFICPRYLTVQAGGAETYCRMLAEKCAQSGYAVELLASCATDPQTWKNEGKERAFEKRDVSVRLFQANTRKNPSRFHELEVRIAEGDTLSQEEEAVWLENSLNSDSMMEYIQNSQSDYFIFMPYLFGIIINGVKIHPEKSVLIPCLHPENFSRLDCIRNLFKQVPKILFNSPPEMELAQELYNLPDEKCFFVSVGFDGALAHDPDRFRKKYGLKRPFITYAGRREGGKNFPLLLEMVRLYQKMYPHTLDFVTFGSGHVEMLSQDQGRIHDLGFLSEEDKFDCYSGALFNCQPSRNESFSIIIMESWLCEVPVLVSQHGAVTSYWTRLSKGGFIFNDYFEFEQILVYGLSHPDRLKEMGKNGKIFVENNFTWKIILGRFREALGI